MGLVELVDKCAVAAGDLGLVRVDAVGKADHLFLGFVVVLAAEPLYSAPVTEGEYRDDRLGHST